MRREHHYEKLLVTIEHVSRGVVGNRDVAPSEIGVAYHHARERMRGKGRYLRLDICVWISISL